MTKSQIIGSIAESTDLTRGQVSSVLNKLEELIERSIKERGVGEFEILSLMKIKTVKKPARKARKKVPNPFRPGELMTVAAKPASRTVKILPLEELKKMANRNGKGGGG